LGRSALDRSVAIGQHDGVGEHGSSYLSQNDAIMWLVEADPLLRSTILGIVVLDHAPEWDQVVNRVARAVEHVPALSHQVARAPLHPTTLQWVPVGEVDLRYHLRRVMLPPPATTADLLEFARTEAASGFDRDRPLWEFTLVEGLDDDRAAFVMKAHHVVTDGIGSVQLAAHLFDFSPDAASDPLLALESAALGSATTVPHHVPTAFERWVDAVSRDVETVSALARAQARSMIPNLLNAVRHPVEAINEVVETAMSVGRVVAPVFDTKSPVMTERQMATRLQTIEVPLSSLRAAAKAAGGTLNDGFLAGITGGLRRYHELHDAEVDELRVAMPISLRTDDDAAGGNHVTVLRFTVPVAVADPAARIGALHEVALRIRAERSLGHTEAIAGVLNFLPKGVIGSMLKHVDFLASNVPGIPIPLHLAGAEVLRFFPFGPTAGSSVNLTLMSYRDLCCIGVHSDTAAIPDSEVFLHCLEEGFAEVLELSAP
jgi:diacylglycerol O-acyltransferase / wax synthase